MHDLTVPLKEEWKRGQRCDGLTPSTSGLVRSSRVELKPWEEKHYGGMGSRDPS
jgi:hypothetical protein